MIVTNGVNAVAIERISASGDENTPGFLVDAQQPPDPIENGTHHEITETTDEGKILFNEDSDPMFDRFTALAKRLFDVPLALVTIIDNDHFWIKSKAGACALTELSNGIAFCSHTILDDSPEVFFVEDALMDARFQNNPLVVGPPFARFYAGRVLKVGDLKIGSLCIVDFKPRKMTEKEEILLIEIAAAISELICERNDRHIKMAKLMKESALTMTNMMNRFRGNLFIMHDTTQSALKNETGIEDFKWSQIQNIVKRKSTVTEVVKEGDIPVRKGLVGDSALLSSESIASHLLNATSNSNAEGNIAVPVKRRNSKIMRDKSQSEEPKSSKAHSIDIDVDKFFSSEKNTYKGENDSKESESKKKIIQSIVRCLKNSEDKNSPNYNSKETETKSAESAVVSREKTKISTLQFLETELGRLRLSLEGHIALGALVAERIQSIDHQVPLFAPCNVLQIIEGVKESLPQLGPRSLQLDWKTENAEELKSSVHITHPKTIYYILVSQIQKYSNNWENINIEVSFTEDVNTILDNVKFCVQNHNVSDIGVLKKLGMLSMKIGASNRKKKTVDSEKSTTQNDGNQYTEINEIDRLDPVVQTLYSLERILKDVGGGLRERNKIKSKKMKNPSVDSNLRDGGNTAIGMENVSNLDTVLSVSILEEEIECWLPCGVCVSEGGDESKYSRDPTDMYFSPSLSLSNPTSTSPSSPSSLFPSPTLSISSSFNSPMGPYGTISDDDDKKYASSTKENDSIESAGIDIDGKMSDKEGENSTTVSGRLRKKVSRSSDLDSVQMDRSIDDSIALKNDASRVIHKNGDDNAAGRSQSLENETVPHTSTKYTLYSRQPSSDDAEEIGQKGTEAEKISIERKRSKGEINDAATSRPSSRGSSVVAPHGTIRTRHAGSHSSSTSPSKKGRSTSPSASNNFAISTTSSSGKFGGSRNRSTQISDDDMEENKRKAAHIAVSSAALLSSMVENDLKQYNLNIEIKKEVNKNNVSSFLGRISRVLSNGKLSSLNNASPQSQTLPSVSALSPVSSFSPTKLKVLLVEDSLVVQKMMRSWLKNHGCDVTTASNGKLGLRCMKDRQFDVCFIDFLMPVMRGVETIVEFHRWADLRPSIPGIEVENYHKMNSEMLIVGMSQGASDNDLHSAFKHGMHFFLTKPVETEMLYTILSKKKNSSSLLEAVEDLAGTGVADLLSHRLPALSPRQAKSKEEKVILTNTNLKTNGERITSPGKYKDEKNDDNEKDKNNEDVKRSNIVTNNDNNNNIINTDISSRSSSLDNGNLHFNTKIDASNLPMFLSKTAKVAPNLGYSNNTSNTTSATTSNSSIITTASMGSPSPRFSTKITDSKVGIIDSDSPREFFSTTRKEGRASRKISQARVGLMGLRAFKLTVGQSNGNDGTEEGEERYFDINANSEGEDEEEEEEEEGEEEDGWRVVGSEKNTDAARYKEDYDGDAEKPEKEDSETDKVVEKEGSRERGRESRLPKQTSPLPALTIPRQKVHSP